MRLKEIKPGMVIHCKTKEDLKKLSDVGISSCFGKRIDEYMKPACFVIIRNGGNADWAISIEEALEYGKITEFSDLIIPDPELSAEEALLAYDQMCKENYCCNDCPIYGILGHECTHKMDGHIGEIMDAIKKWKADHEKKEPEIEIVDICRIIEILPDGRKRCVHEEDIDLPFDGYERQRVEEILKRYCMEHDGEYIAVREVVSRVKAVK